MRYRGLKRVLGETSLERKCRLLFGTCLALLITGAFWAVDRIAEDLVMTATRSKCRDLVDMALLREHFDILISGRMRAVLSSEEATHNAKSVGMMLAEIQKNQHYEHQILWLGGERYKPTTWLDPTRPEAGSREESILQLLKSRKEEQDRLQKGQTQAMGSGEPEPPPLNPSDLLADLGKFVPVHEEVRMPADDKYEYFEPIYWSPTCETCHLSMEAAGSVPLSLGAAPQGDARPFVAVKVVIPYKATQHAINHARAILIAVAILTVFAAMIALYVIIRYVVVKPLKHLRDVSDEVSRGQTEVRAEIHTNDEFEELAASFNRMLRHLTDTQTALRQVNTDLDGKVDQLAQLNMRLYEMNRLKGDFLANMSHELRTPLNSIIGFSEVLQGIESLNDKQKRYAQNIQKSGRLLLEMINDILDLAKMEAGKMEVRPTDFSLDAIVHAQCDMVRSLTEEKNIDLEVNIQPDVPRMFQDQAKVQQILTNLLSNAIKFTPEGGRITVSAVRDAAGRLALSVADTGVGIAEEDREIIFEKFRQAPLSTSGDNLTREYSGTGLGLSILKELCKLLGGEVSFESKLGIGSTFTVVLPWIAQSRSELDSELTRRFDELEQQQRAITASAATLGLPRVELSGGVTGSGG